MLLLVPFNLCPCGARVIDLRLGRWQEALADVGEVDAVITDPPYSARTHEGHDAIADNMLTSGHLSPDGIKRRAINYSAWSPADVDEFVGAMTPRCRGWFVALTDHVLAPAWEVSFLARGWLCFPPLPIVIRGSRVRMQGDGPSCVTIQIVAARPRNKRMAAWGTLPGYYDLPAERAMTVTGGKPLLLMGAIVRDYSRPGDLICDPCAGGATTLIAAAMEGRRAVGSEMDPKTYELARQRIAKGHTPDMFSALDNRAT